jgi:hypothetical protein
MLGRSRQPVLTREERDGLIAMLMRIDENVAQILEATVDEDDGEEEEDRP